MTPLAPFDTPQFDITKRQGDVSATLIYIAPGGVPANVGGWNFIFSATCGGNLLTEVTTADVGLPSGQPLDFVNSPGFTVPSYNSTVSVPLFDSTGFTPAMFVSIPGFGVFQVSTVPDVNDIVIYNSGFPSNLANQLVPVNTPVYVASNVGYAVVVIPASITDWNSTAPVSSTRSTGKFPYWLKYETDDPSPPGPFKKTFSWGNLNILSQNDPTA